MMSPDHLCTGWVVQCCALLILHHREVLGWCVRCLDPALLPWVVCTAQCGCVVLHADRHCRVLVNLELLLQVGWGWEEQPLGFAQDLRSSHIRDSI
jgi:hypothetical protein